MPHTEVYLPAKVMSAAAMDKLRLRLMEGGVLWAATYDLLAAPCCFVDMSEVTHLVGLSYRCKIAIEVTIDAGGEMANHAAGSV